MVVALALSLAMATSGEPAATELPAAEQGSVAAPASEDQAEPSRAPGAESPSSAGPEPVEALDLRGPRHDLVLGPHSTTFWSHTDHHYTFRSVGLGYLASWGRRGLFVHATGLLPLQGREDGRVHAVASTYGARYGGDLLTGFQWRWRALRSLETEAGAGPHATVLVLRGKTGYRDFSASPLGLGTAASLRWRTGRALSRWPVTVAVHGSAALDFYDPIHGDDLRHGFTFRLGVSVGLAPGGRR